MTGKGDVMTEDEIKALCKIRDKYCQWGEVAVMDKAIRLILDQQNEIRLLKEIFERFAETANNEYLRGKCDATN